MLTHSEKKRIASDVKALRAVAMRTRRAGLNLLAGRLSAVASEIEAHVVNPRRADLPEPANDEIEIELEEVGS